MTMHVSDEMPDWSREALTPGEWSPGKRLLAESMLDNAALKDIVNQKW